MRRGSSRMILAALILSGMIGGASAQEAAPAKGSAEHIRAAIGKIDGTAIRANARTSRDWPGYGLDYAETRFSRLSQINVDKCQGPRPRLGL